MISLGTVFHALAALALGWLVLRVVGMSADRDFARALFASRVTVDWLGPYLERFCRVWGLPFEHSGPLKFGEPARREGRVLLDLHFHQGLMGIRVHPSPSGSKVVVRLRERPRDEECVLRHLREALGSESIEIET